MEPSGRVFVTVGTTSFDALIRIVDSNEFQDVLLSRGYSSLRLQIGRGTYLPQITTRERDDDHHRLRVDYFTFAPNLGEQLSSADLVISHAGSGSIFETLRAGKPLVVVINEDLMDNHQCELAEELARNRFLICAKPSTLVAAVKAMELGTLLPYPRSSPAALVAALDKFLG
ncbi:hypothetical protein SELMODRAFT_232928 [Selaginella moellendorffii]|uniref:Glycosyl transferase family 28 C-terminal domain-containing protein n=1 Tax=Selaginella moellendorffii TaxID=88036 RepID=D8S1Q7_SELML|nr:UDP-N-acetylglucosamine transferase subunit ALG13 homolog [Selaginella moellendorffii]XP_002992174.1 UDP-N-acetylglucosamine transferase subunit ALG13 homolog [Selaginella moellendorffii]EFJ06829.1 hypothetical protein SELMODRAFT_134806 [Selaginella moellendorffii]EFJ21895.1 hypothetical protein SELMODRAFT_232928 [Selaginella moellendorffii]|eukprot:XP_002977286.1 UDP-N-acetylglucosamine transferase subunit ALG13 homolog [Selaginella moellendorffii]